MSTTDISPLLLSTGCHAMDTFPTPGGGGGGVEVGHSLFEKYVGGIVFNRDYYFCYYQFVPFWRIPFWDLGPFLFLSMSIWFRGIHLTINLYVFMWLFFVSGLWKYYFLLLTTNTQPSQHLLGWDSFDYPLFFDIRVITLAWADRKMLQRMASNGSKLVVEHHPLAQVTTTYGNAGTAMRNHSIQNGSISLQWFHNKLTQWRAITKKAVMCIFFAGFYIFSSKFLLAPIEFRGTALKTNLQQGSPRWHGLNAHWRWASMGQLFLISQFVKIGSANKMTAYTVHR